MNKMLNQQHINKCFPYKKEQVQHKYQNDLNIKTKRKRKE